MRVSYYSRGSIHDLLKSRRRGRAKTLSSSASSSASLFEDDDNDRISIQLKLKMMYEASLGIGHLHEMSIIHRDNELFLKTHNIISRITDLTKKKLHISARNLLV